MIYTYKFADGTTTEVAVSEELYAELTKHDNQEKCNNETETRRHVSLDYLKQVGAQIANTNTDPLVPLFKEEIYNLLLDAINLLPKKQKELIRQRYFEGKTVTEIAKSEGVLQSAVSHRFKSIYKKLKKLLEKSSYYPPFRAYM